MTTFAVLPIVQAGFSFAPSYSDGRMRLTLSGNADMSAQMALSAALRQVHAEALRLGVPEVECDFGALYFMSSSCFKAFVTWVTSIMAIDPTKRYRIRLRENHQLAWQKRSVEALRCLAEKIVVVES